MLSRRKLLLPATGRTDRPPATEKSRHAGLMANPSAGPITYLLDGKQYVLVAAGDSLYAFTVNQPAM
jgi:hypothetical protein